MKKEDIIKYTFKFMTAFCILLAWGPPVQAKILNVPSEYTTIRNAITYSSNGDEIVVAPGVYKEQIAPGGRDLIIRSTFSGDWSVVRNTIIEETPSGPVVSFRGEESSKFVLRGFTLRGGSMGIDGSGTHATIEYNIITNCITPGANAPNGIGVDPFRGIIQNCDGLIQNNIIEDNIGGQGGAFRQCDGTIQNNLIRNNRTIGGQYYDGRGIFYYPGVGGAFMDCNGLIRNNTVVDNFNYDRSTQLTTPGGFLRCQGTIVNNLIYHTTMTLPLEFDNNSTPTYCLFRDPHVGQGNITGDPKFMNPISHDYRLKSDSPAIGAGKAQPYLKYDLQGFTRGTKAGTPGRGDGSGTGIGAYEVLPRPVAVWLPYGGPAEIREGAALAVSWALEPPAGNTIRLRLFKSGNFVAYLGPCSGAGGTATLTLPASLYSGSDYAIQGYTPTIPVYDASTPPFTIAGTRTTAVRRDNWLQYE